MTSRYATPNLEHLRGLIANETDECITWDRGRAGNYGALCGAARAHRQVCLWVYGPAPTGLEAAHSCGQSLCVNPRHLRWATHRSNIADKQAHDTLRSGERHNMAKLSASQVADLRESDGSLATVAALFGISKSQAHRIRTNQNWKG